jgi:hypothetical protein
MRNNESSLQHRINNAERELAKAIRRQDELQEAYQDSCAYTTQMETVVEELRQQME